MKTILITDTHVDENNIELVDSIFEQTISYCIENSVSVIFHLGDWFKSRKGQPQSVLSFTKNVFKKIGDNNIKLYIIPGNHDKSDLSSKESFLDSYSDYKNIHLIDTYDIIDFDKLTLFFLPFFKEEVYLDYLKIISLEASKSRNSYLFTHQALNGVKNNDNSIVEGNIGTNLFNNFNQVFVGHYHNVQKYSNIYYIGSSHPVNFGEDNNKGIVLFDTESQETQRIKLNYPEYKKLEINIEALTMSDINDLVKMKNDSDDNIRLIVKGKSEAINSFDRTLLQNNGIDVELKSDEVEKQMIKADDDEYDIFTVDSIKEEFKNFCEEKNHNYDDGKVFLNYMQ